MKRLYKVTSSTTTLFVADDSFGVRIQESSLPIVKVEEVKTLEDLPKGLSGDELILGCADDCMTAKKWFEERDQYRIEKIDLLKSELESLRSQLLKLGVEFGYELNQIEGSNV